MADSTVTIIFKGGAQISFEATEREKIQIADQWSKHIGDPASQVLIGATYADGKGDLRLNAADIAGFTFLDK